jgi:tetratricopeptide (TPR) repeat protein
VLNAALTADGAQSAMTASMLADPYEDGLRLSAENRHAEAIDRFERALRVSPNDPRVLFALGNTARALGLAKPAQEFFNRVLALEPGRIEALVNLANLLRAEGNFASACAILAPALTRNPDAPELWLTLGSVYREIGDWARAAEHYRAALALRPDYPPALGNLADLLADEGGIEEALELYGRVLAREPKNTQARLNRSILHLLQGNLKDGWRDYAARLKIPGKAPICDHGLAAWSGATLKRTRLLVTAEQGVGDQIMFASVIPDLLERARVDGGALILECEPRLATLFARSFPGATVRPSRMETKAGVTTAHYDWLKSTGGANAAIELGSLPRYLRKSVAQFPDPHSFLVADAGERTHWRDQFAGAGRGPYIGICWRSGKTGGARSLQYAPREVWAEFLRALPGTIVCAQYDAAQEELTELQALSGRTIFLPPLLDQKNELDRTCAMLSALDAVASAPTAVSWLAAGAGVPTFKILHDTSWTSFGETYEPFAPSCACISPDASGDWREAFAKALRAIRETPGAAS